MFGLLQKLVSACAARYRLLYAKAKASGGMWKEIDFEWPEEGSFSPDNSSRIQGMESLLQAASEIDGISPEFKGEDSLMTEEFGMDYSPTVSDTDLPTDGDTVEFVHQEQDVIATLANLYAQQQHQQQGQNMEH